MSPLWRDQIHIFLGPTRVDWVRWKRGFRPVTTGRETVFCNFPEGGPLWIAALQRLEQILEQAAGSDVCMILSNHFVRYVALPPQTEITTPEEVKSYADFRMREVYADHVDNWILSISDWNPFEGAVCAAIPQELMMQVEQLTSVYRCKIKTMEPYLASVYDRWQAQLKNEKVYFAVVETGRICLAITHRGMWQSIRNQRILHRADEDLLAALDQEVIWSGSKDAMEFVYLFAPEHPELTLPPDSGWSIIPLPAGKIQALAHYPAAAANHYELDQCPV